MKISLFLAALIGWILPSCDNRGSSYESHFPDSVSIDFPPGYRFDEKSSITGPIDRYLRERKLGFVSGIMGVGEEGRIDQRGTPDVP